MIKRWLLTRRQMIKKRLLTTGVRSRFFYMFSAEGIVRRRRAFSA